MIKGCRSVKLFLSMVAVGVTTFFLEGCFSTNPDPNPPPAKAMEIISPEAGDTLNPMNACKLIVKYDKLKATAPVQRDYSIDTGKTWKAMNVDVVGYSEKEEYGVKYGYEIMLWEPLPDNNLTKVDILIKVLDYNDKVNINDMIGVRVD
ncbi:MAG: hypothetical protein JW795_11825 [Chitinivibrionales bacterium]|nr:hypothetical protein [Chitinivibrionales bacterium]